MSEVNQNLERKILFLEEEVLKLKKEKDTMLQTIYDMYKINNEIMVHISKIIGEQSILDTSMCMIKARCDNLRYELLDPCFRRDKYFFPLIKSTDETIEEIINGGKSIARFGDGEFAQIVKLNRHKFQRLDDKLGARLEEVLHSHHPNMLIAIANNYGSLQYYTENAADGIRFYMVGGETRKQHTILLEHDRIYYDAYISRPYVMYEDNMTDAPKKRFENLKRIWKGRKVLIVEGAQTRMGIGNDLLDGAEEIIRILAPATSSFDRYDEILEAALKFMKNDMLCLIAMGPSAGVLAYDLTVAGYQALDIGHLDLEYEWFLAGKGERTAVPNKYNNEFAEDNCVEEIHDLAYEGQIVASFQ